MGLGRLNTDRFGTSLVEIMVVIATMGVVLGTTATTLHRIYRVDADVRAEVHQMMSVSDLAARFRQDAHAAIASTASQENRLVFELVGGQTVEYRFANNAIQRTKRHGEQVLHRRSFRMLDESQGNFRVIESSGRHRAALAILHPTRELRIEAVVGLLPQESERKTQGNSK